MAQGHRGRSLDATLQTYFAAKDATARALKPTLPRMSRRQRLLTGAGGDREANPRHGASVRVMSEAPQEAGSTMAVDMPHWSHTTRLEATPISASQARAFVSQHLAGHRLSRLDDPVRLVASELATNALVHARTAFSVTLSAPNDRTVLLTVRDSSASLPERRADQVMRPGGRGLEIVDLVSSDWGVDEEPSGCKAVWASFKTARTGPASAVESRPSHATASRLGW